MARINGNNRSNTLNGTLSNDVIYGLGGNDSLFGWAGNDVLEGGSGSDYLEGGEGNDALIGGYGWDTYDYTKGDGADTIDDNGSYYWDWDRLNVHGYDADEVFMQRAAPGSTTIVISFGGENGGDSITLVDMLGSSGSEIEQVRLDDGTNIYYWNIYSIANNTPPVALDDDGGTQFQDTDIVLQAADLLANDSDADLDNLTVHSVFGATNGTVTMDADGTITFTPDAGYVGAASFQYTVTDGTAAANATVGLEFELGFSDFIGNWWAEVIDLSASNLPCYIDCHYGNDVATGSDLRDLILGNLGDDTLHGGGGNDDFLVDLGHGFDRFFGDAGYDKVVAMAENVQIGLIGDFAGTVEEFSCAGFANVSILGTWQWQTLDFSNVILTDIAAIDAGLGNDTVFGSAGDDVIIGNMGDDTLAGNGGDDDFLVGLNHGFDTFDGGAGYDQVLASADGVQIGLFGDFDNQVEEISANGFTGVSIRGNWTAQTFDFSSMLLTGITEINMEGGHDVAVGSAGDNVLVGGTGNDVLTGLAGVDTFVFHGGDGQDVITDFGIGDDVVRLDQVAGFEAFADVQAALSQNGADALLDLGGGQSVLFENILASGLASDQFEFV
ncbi:MAG: cadherin-like domain-containing protein [Pseudomonadota bacterium]